MAMPRHAVKRKAAVTLSPQRRGHLRVIQGGGNNKPKVSNTKKKSTKASIRRSRLTFLAVSGLVVAAFVFGLVLLNIYLAQSSFRLEAIKANVIAEESQYRRMRYEVARAESPEKVAAAATGLGLVIPSQQEYIQGPPTETRLARSTSPIRGDEAMKALLEPRP